MLPDGVVSASVVTKNGKIIAVKDYSYDRTDLGISNEYVLSLLLSLSL